MRTEAEREEGGETAGQQQQKQKECELRATRKSLVHMALIRVPVVWAQLISVCFLFVALCSVQYFAAASCSVVLCVM